MSFLIHSIHLKNFVTFKDQKIPLKDQGLVLIKGDNQDEPHKGANAAGKSLIGDSILWLFSGNTSRDIRADEVIGKFSRSCSVSAKVQANQDIFQITRYRKDPKYGNSLQIRSGKDVSHRHIKENEHRIQEIIGCSWPLFKLSCFQYGNESEYFSRLSSSNRAKILDEIVGASEADVPKRYTLINKEIRNLEEQLRSIEYANHNHRSTIDASYRNIRANEVMVRDSDSMIKSEIANKKKYIEALREVEPESIEKKIIKTELEVKKAQENDAKLLSIQERIDQLKELQHDIEKHIAVCASRIKSDEKQIIEMEKEGGICYRCGNKVTKESLNNVVAPIESRIEKEEAALAKHRQSFHNIQSRINQLNKDVSNLLGVEGVLVVRRKLKELEREFNRAVQDVTTANEMEMDLKKLSDKHLTNITAMRAEIKRLTNDIKKHEQAITDNFFRAWLLNYKIQQYETLSKFYSPSGFRPFVMQQYSPVLSDCSNFFYKNLTCDMGEITVNSRATQAGGKAVDKIEIEVSEHGKSKSFPGAWSSGDGSCVDLSLNLGIMKLAMQKAGKEFGIAMFDEITSHMSPKLNRLLIQTIRDKLVQKNKTVCLTSHTSVPEENFDHVWTVQKCKGQSKIIFER